MFRVYICLSITAYYHIYQIALGKEKVVRLGMQLLIYDIKAMKHIYHVNGLVLYNVDLG